MLDCPLLFRIQKNKRKSINVCDNYRTIALSRILGKLLNNLILIKYHDALVPLICNFGLRSPIVQQNVHLLLMKLSNITKIMIQMLMLLSCLYANRAFARVNYVKLFRFLVKPQVC